MDLYPDATDFLHGWRVAKRNDVLEHYVQVFLMTYKESGDSHYSKNNALRVALNKSDSTIYNYEVI